ncbi:hypothetical protein Cs7R123_17990 [Catellatospora sp. TT07R-123]|uniref:DUF6289 family protein n=1 Tax=Catellatospora sp. TT07R-123 TaxID=2733863 RepID=UPI001AFE5709|nr:DUF6289 family protein [Catellatospora sp. TT07R-123]GHJ44457.1 hypothetical protein Cs7R123_17990 [Catellatospora sp. TT07R-123]
MKRRIAALALAAAGAAAVLVPGAPAQAYGQCLANTKCGWLYYADAAHTRLQGGHTTNCEGTVLDWGIKAGYSVFISEQCVDLPPVE